MPADTTDKQNSGPDGASIRRFVVLHHTDHLQEADHYDLMIENGAALATWRVGEPPDEIDSAAPLVRLPDHRLEYLAYEGPVSNNRGQVQRHDEGTCTVRRELKEWHIQFNGKLLGGHWIIRSVATTGNAYISKSDKA